MDFFDYNSSPLNPFLKSFMTVIFFGALIVYVYVRRLYTDKIRSFIDMLIFFIIFITVALIFRFYGDGIIFGFTKEFSLRWLQSLALVISAVFFTVAAYKLKNLFGEEEDKEDMRTR